MAQHEEGLCEEFLETVPTSSYLTEPPDADPHVRWCGRRAVIPSPYPNLLRVLTLIPYGYFFQCIVKVIARRSQSQVQDKPRKEDHFYVIAKR